MKLLESLRRTAPGPALSALPRRGFNRAAFWIAPFGVAVALGAVATLPARPDAPAERYALPITPPVDQGDTGLCWVFATLSMLETNYMQRHPGERIELSRAALQREAIADRFRRFLRGEPGPLQEGGLAVEALALIRENGLLDRNDFHDIVASEPALKSIEQAIAAEVDSADKRKALAESLRATLGDAPLTTHLGGVTLHPAELARTVVGGRHWIEFDRSADGSEGWGPSRDPDARADTRVRYVSLDRMIDLIHQSLRRGEAVVSGTVDHAMLIHGAEYDRYGKPIAYLIKDSLAPYAYRLRADELHGSLTDVTVSVENSDAA